MRIVLIGAGNLMSSLAPALWRAGHELLQVFSRTERSAKRLAERVGGISYTITLNDVVRSADVYLYAIPDECYPLKPIDAPNAVHLLTSGSVPYSALTGTPHCGVLYPFQTFSKEKPVEDFSQIPVLVEGSDEQSLAVAEELAQSVSDKVYKSTAQSRARLHLAGVLANNFSNCLYALAKEQLDIAGLPFDLLLPLIDETARKVHTLDPRDAQTGPAARGDKAVMQKQMTMLPEELRPVYSLLSENIRCSASNNS